MYLYVGPGFRNGPVEWNRLTLRSDFLGLFVTWIKLRGTFQSFWDLTEIGVQSWYKVCTYYLVNPTFNISLWFLLLLLLLVLCFNFLCVSFFLLIIGFFDFF